MEVHAICYYNDDSVRSDLPVTADVADDLLVDWTQSSSSACLTQEGPVAQEGPVVIEQEDPAMSIDSIEEDLGAAAPVGRSLSPDCSACYARAGWSYTPSPLSEGSQREFHEMEDLITQLGRISIHHMFTGRGLQRLQPEHDRGDEP